MSMSRYQIRNRSLWAGRGRHIPDDWYNLDPNKSVIENAFDIFRELSTTSTTESRRLSLLSGFVKLLANDHYTTADANDLQSNGSTIVSTSDVLAAFSVEDYLYCLSASLVHQFTQIRAASLRAIRHLIRLPQDVVAFNELQLPHLVCRSFDVVLDNEEERMQVIKLIRKMLSVAPTLISPIIVRSLVALGDSVAEDSDRMLRVSLAVLCELGVLHPTALIVCGGVGAITRNVLECHSPRIAESLVGVLLHLLERAGTRRIAGVRLDCLAAPYCDFTYRLGIMDKNKDARDLRFTSSRLALLSVLRSWAGTIEFCDPNKPSGLKAIVDVLYLNQLEVRRAILDLLYELLWLPQPIWTDEYSVALAVVDPADYQDSWRLTEGFVSMEGRSVLPSLAASVPNICELHTAFLLYCFLETGLLNALVEVVVTGDTFISVRATVLIGKLLQLMHTHLPAEILNTSSALPTLVSHAIQGNHQAKGAITALHTLHTMLKNRPAACSLFLDAIIQSGSVINSKIFRREIDPSAQLPDFTALFDTNNDHTITNDTLNSLTPDTSHRHLSFSGMSSSRRKRIDSVGSSASTSGDERPSSTVLSMSKTFKRVSQKRIRNRQFYENLKQNERLMRDSNVLSNADGKTWDWDIIVAILRTDAVDKMDDTQCRFIRALVHYYKPSSNRFSHQDLGHGRNIPAFVTAGLELIDWLLQSQALECIRFLTDLFSDINTHLMAIITSRSAHDCLFSPQHMSSTMCQQYFLFIGRMCRTQKGLEILNNTDIFERLSSIVNKTIHVCYIKLIVSGLDYTYDDLPRTILEQAMQASERRAGRLYATQFMLVLLRAKITNFEVWGLPLLITQTKDTNRVVALTALEILDEAAHDRIYLEELVSLWPRFDELGDPGHLLMTRFYSIPRGLNHPEACISERVDFWVKGYNKCYALLVEADTHSVLTLHTKNEDGAYNRRSCSSRPVVVPPNLLPHMFGQLVQTIQGLANLIKFGNLAQMCDRLAQARCSTDAESLALKEAIWALSHASTSRIGLKHVLELDSTLASKIIVLAKHCDVYSVRATAFQALGLIGSTKAGADLLYTLDWLCVRHDRNTFWPICEPEDWLTKQLTPVRHTLEEVPPYNYTAIDENIGTIRFPHDGNPLEDSSATTFFFDDTSSERAEIGSNSEFDARVNATAAALSSLMAASAARSRTLPEGIAGPGLNSQTNFHKHTRSLSESKTTDGISLMGTDAAAQTTNRTRFNSGTDSNTSGVSSCESVYGRYMLLNELHYHTNTLSPIPSSSNLLEVKNKSAATNERFRRISLTGASFRENTLSPQDAQGYAQLRKLRFNQRPMFSESAAEDLANFMESGVGGGGGDGNGNVLSSSRFSSTSSVGGVTQQQRRLKVRSLDRHSNLTAGLEDIVRTQSAGSATIRPMQAIDDNSPCYSGICLPKNILDLFLTNTPSNTYVSQFNHDADLQSRIQHRSSTTQPNSAAHHVQLSASFSIVDAFNEDDPQPGSVSSLSDTSSATASTANKRSSSTKWSAAKHNRSACMLCCRQSSQVVRSNSIDATDSAAPTHTHIPRRRNSSQTDGFFLNRTPSSFDDLMPPVSTSDIALNDATTITDNILRQVQRMANPVWGKQCKMALLEIKQKHPAAYQDICLYAEVCRALSNSSYRLYARRFLQELFLDLNFDSFTAVSADICLRREREFSLQQQVGGVDSVDGVRKPTAALLRSTAQFNGGGLNSSTTTSMVAPSTAEHSSTLGFPAGDHIYVNVKTHLRHPQLESVFETSVENLAESLGRNNKHMASTTTKLMSDNSQEDTPALRRIKNDQKIVAHRHSDVPKSNSQQSANQSSSSTSSSNNNHRCSSMITSFPSSSSSSNQPPTMRPRFNTLELDLSCTKNKFPITDRRKQIQQLIREKNPNSAPATPTEWSFQVARNGDPHGFLSANTTSSNTRITNSSQPAITITSPHPHENGLAVHKSETNVTTTTATAATAAPPPKLPTTTSSGDTIH